jgi:hypothetical protein
MIAWLNRLPEAPDAAPLVALLAAAT